MRATFSPHANMLRGVCAAQFGMLILASSAVASYVILAGVMRYIPLNDTCDCQTSLRDGCAFFAEVFLCMPAGWIGAKKEQKVRLY